MKIELTIARNSINELSSVEKQLFLRELRNQLHEQYPDADIDIDLGLQGICYNSQDDDSVNQHVERIAQQTFDGDSWWLSSYHEA